MRKLKYSLSLLLILSLIGISFSCASTGMLTDVLSGIESTAKQAGDSNVAAFAGLAASVSKASDDITPENEYYIGRSVAASVIAQYPVYENPKQEAYINKIAQTLLLNSDAADLYNGYHVKILDSSELNAFATSGGHIFITRGMLECVKNEDTLAAVIAHEISHIQLKHSSSVIKSSRYTNVATKATSAILTVNEKAELAEAMDSTVGDVINQLFTKGYSKTQEYDADSNALILMNNAGYNPKAMITLLEKMDETLGKSAGGIFKTHPAPKDRIKNVQTKLSGMSIVEDTSSFRQKRFDSIMM